MGGIRPEGEFSHSVFVVETVAWVGPGRQDQAFPLGLLVCRSVPWCWVGSPCALNAGRGRSSRACFGWRGAGRKGFGFIQSPEGETITGLGRKGPGPYQNVTALLSYRGGSTNCPTGFWAGRGGGLSSVMSGNERRSGFSPLILTWCSLWMSGGRTYMHQTCWGPG